MEECDLKQSVLQSYKTEVLQCTVVLLQHHVNWRKQEIYSDNHCNWKGIVSASQNNSADKGLEQ